MNFMKNLLKKSVKEYQKSQDLSLEVGRFSNEARTLSKGAIALLRRDNIADSEEKLKKAENNFALISKIAKNNKNLLRGSYCEAVEEYIEAIIFYNFLTKQKKEISDYIEVRPDDIISGICDFTGELARRAVNIANKDNLKELILYKEVVEDVVGELTKIGFRGKARQKYDEAERNLRKIEDILYDIRLKA
jgi:translin